jgi:hypothetical protein
MRQTRTLDLLVGVPTPSQLSQQHPQMLIAQMIQLDLVEIYMQNK